MNEVNASLAKPVIKLFLVTQIFYEKDIHPWLSVVTAISMVVLIRQVTYSEARWWLRMYQFEGAGRHRNVGESFR